MLCQVATFEARLWFGLDQAREAFLEEEPAAPELARMEGGTGVGYVYVHADPAAELAESLSELTLVASSSFSELFHQSGAFRGCLTALLESVGARAELLDLEGNLHPVFWLDGQTFRGLSLCQCTTEAVGISARPSTAFTTGSCPCPPHLGVPGWKQCQEWRKQHGGPSASA